MNFIRLLMHENVHCNDAIMQAIEFIQRHNYVLLNNNRQLLLQLNKTTTAATNVSVYLNYL